MAFWAWLQLVTESLWLARVSWKNCLGILPRANTRRKNTVVNFFMVGKRIRRKNLSKVSEL
jgi:hypothetical protein